MSVVLQAKPMVEALKKIQEEMRWGIGRTIGIIRVGQRPGDICMQESIVNNCRSIGIRVKSFVVEGTIIVEDFIWLITKVKKDYDICGIVFLGPVPAQMDSNVIKKIANPLKIIECMSPVNVEKVAAGE